MLYALAALLIATLVAGDFTPTAPGPGDSFPVGGQCTIKWVPAQAGEWKNVTINLMTGSNNEMRIATTVVSGLDGSDPSLSPYNWTCPDVNPNSAIYFYEFINDADIQKAQWTTRFTITSRDGSHSPPEHETQPNGDSIPWGTGTLSSSNSSSSYSAASSSTKTRSDESTETSTHKGKKGSKTAAPEREASPTIGLPPPSSSVSSESSSSQSGGRYQGGYTAASYSSARSNKRPHFWSPSLLLVIALVSWLL